MSHNVESMFSVKMPAWHGLGVIVNEAPTAEEAIKLAGLDWEAQEKQVFHFQNDSSQRFDRIPKYKAIVRGDNQQVLSIMKDQYHPLQNKDAFNFFNPFVESGLASFETAGSLKDGRVIWVLATLNKAPIDVGSGDVIHKHLLLSNSHDGSMAVRVGFTPVRVVCNNTLTMSHGSKDSQLLRIKHSSKVVSRLDQVQEIVNAMDARFEATAEQYKALSKTDVNQKDLENYVNVIFELRPNGNEREKARARSMQETITKLFENGAGAQLKSSRGTAWGLYNSVTNYLTHIAGKEGDSRLYSNWFGDLSRKNEKALEEALVLV